MSAEFDKLLKVLDEKGAHDPTIPLLTLLAINKVLNGLAGRYPEMDDVPAEAWVEVATWLEEAAVLMRRAADAKMGLPKAGAES